MPRSALHHAPDNASQRLAAMGQAARTLARPNAAAELADAVAALAQRRLPASERQRAPLQGR